MGLPTYTILIGSILLAAVIGLLIYFLLSTHVKTQRHFHNSYLDLSKYSPIRTTYLTKTAKHTPIRVDHRYIHCSDCYVSIEYVPKTPAYSYTHECTVNKKSWKIMISDTDSREDVFISLQNHHFKS